MAEPSGPFDQLIRQGRECHARQDLDGALRLFQAACELRPGAVQARLLVGQMLQAVGRTDEAFAAYRALVDQHPSHVGALGGLGQVYRERGDWQGALDCLQRATLIDPQRLALRCDLGAVLRELRRYDEARAAYEGVLTIDAAYVAALTGLGQTCRQQGDLSAALGYFRRAATLDPERPRFALEVAAILRDLGRMEEAAAAYHALLSRHPGHVDALIGLAALERSRGNQEQSLALLTAADAARPEYPPVLFEQARCLRRLERFDEAERIYQAILRGNPQSSTALRGLVQIALARCDCDAAIDLAQAACAAEPALVENMLSLAAANRDAGRFAEATRLVESAIAQAPQHVGAWIEKGLGLRAQGERRAALEAFGRAMQLDPGRAAPEVATEQLALGDYQAAHETYGRILAGTPAHFGASMGLAGLQMLAGDFLSCIDTCEHLISHYPKRLAPYRQKCLALIQLDRADEAMQVAASLQDGLVPETELDALRLDLCRVTGRQSEVFALLRKIDMRPGMTFAVWHQAMLARLAFFDLDSVEDALKRIPPHRFVARSQVIHARAALADLRWKICAAIDLYKEALTIRAHDPGAHEQLARLYVLRADAPRAEQHREIAIQQSQSSLTLSGHSLNVSQSISGQLLNELKLDPGLARELAGIADQAPAERIDALRPLQTAGDGLTPPAMQMMIALRQAGVLDDPQRGTPSGDGVTTRIPSRIVQFWDQPLPPRTVAQMMASWAAAHPDYEYRRFDHHGAQAYLSAHYPGEVVMAFRRATHPAQASDLFRLAYLLREGGFYLDADDLCIGHLSKIATRQERFIAYQEQYGTVGNNFLGCEPGEPVIARALQLAVAALNRGDKDLIWLATGPGLMTRAFVAELLDQGANWRAWLQERRILSRGELVRSSWSHAVLGYKNTSQSWLQREFKSGGTAREQGTANDTSTRGASR